MSSYRMSARALGLVTGLAIALSSVLRAESPLAARGESPTAFDGRCIPALSVARRSNIPDILPPRALIAGRLARLGATRDFHHGLQAQAAAADKPKKLSMDIRVTPAVSFAPSRIRAIAELRLPDDRTAEFYCATVEWDWGDLTESEESNECEPYEAGVSDVKRVFTAEHTFQTGGRYRVQLRLKRNRKVLASTSTVVTVRPGVRDPPPYGAPEP